MAQHGSEHLTTIQLSAYLDRELPADELALCTAHLGHCQTCQAALADVRLTARLLRGLPEVEVPRSFVLSASMVGMSPTPVARSRSGGMLVMVRRVARPLSALAALVGVILLLLGAATGLLVVNRSAFPTTAPASNASSSLEAEATAESTASHIAIPSPSLATGLFSPTAQQTARAATTGVAFATATPVARSSTGSGPNNMPPASTSTSGPPTLFDPGQPVGQAVLGALLLIVGLLGLFVTRQRRPLARR